MRIRCRIKEKRPLSEADLGQPGEILHSELYFNNPNVPMSFEVVLAPVWPERPNASMPTRLVIELTELHRDPWDSDS